MKRLFTFCLIATALLAEAQGTTVVKLKTSPALGKYLADRNDKTLYFFSNDADGNNHCTGGCVGAWPVFAGDAPSQAELDKGLSASDFGVVSIDGGQKQITYKGWPLYYFSPKKVPEAPNAITGDGAGGVWYVAKPDYTVMLANDQLTGNDGKKYKPDYTEGEGKSVYLTDANGRALYVFKNDKANKNNFSKEGSPSKSWIIFQADAGDIVVPSKLDKSLFGTIDVFGAKQLTYKGWPLYYFGKDEGMRGSNKGVSVPKPGVWPIAAKDIPPAGR